MARYETEEQQVEAIKQFWKENGTVIVLGAVLGLGGLWGWRYYNTQQLQAQEQASSAYQQKIEQLEQDNGFSTVKQFVEQQGESDYAVLAALHLAQEAVDRDDLSEAAKQLSFAADHSSVEAVAHVARLRLARVQLQQEQPDASLKSLQSIPAEQFVAQVEELKGDIYRQQGNFEQARVAYQAALEQSAGNRLLQMKLDNLSAEANA
ncbi:UPF0070 protein YfgM [Saliniradius amylolyticus]|uniref:Ancillary SecYEG translocon subunit n=1 Tax=Saliniradius amylolyticus TaxID=2183582 RepID=A0A2S2E4W4_9ALTE|nr:tetratricopeptide repeat protein [Saliniradius amylolyticus]AWL12698.1 UPF0070 protein YfgM [Saliniradius amylolyticus]